MWILRGERKNFSIGTPNSDETHMLCHMGEEELGEIDQKDSLYPPKDTSQMAHHGKKRKRSALPMVITTADPHHRGPARRELGWKDSNLRMVVPKTTALPLGDTPKREREDYLKETFPSNRELLSSRTVLSVAPRWELAQSAAVVEARFLASALSRSSATAKGRVS